jgi:hypothetical protein
VAGDKGRGALFCKGWDQLLKQGLGAGKGRWQEIRNRGLCSARYETSCSSGCRMVARGSSYPLVSLGFVKLEYSHYLLELLYFWELWFCLYAHQDWMYKTTQYLWTLK